MAAEELYCKGTRVWLKDDEAVWIVGTVSDPPSDDQLAVATAGSTELIDVSGGTDAFPPLCNPDILVGNSVDTPECECAGQQEHGTVLTVLCYAVDDDLTNLSYLHEPAVIHSLEVRFCENKSIYTYSGIVLVAINPYARLPLYTPEVIAQYSSAEQDAALDPHVFAIAENAYRCLFREGRNQSIIVSGESGAGKTVSAKFAMRYFASVGGAANMTQIEKKVLASNPVMEAIGNAKTTRNDNSSRFGKYIELQFSEEQVIVGATMRTYLLEKSRVVHQAENERNYHIFYQMCAQADSALLADLEISEPDDFFITKQGDAAVVPDVDDAEDFSATTDALRTLGLEEERVAELFRILAGLMHLGNVEVRTRSKRTDDAIIPDDDTHLPVAAGLLGVEPSELSKWATHRKIQTGKEVFTKPLTATDAGRAVHAFAKHIYAHVFDWIVAKVNASLAAPHKGGKPLKTIGVLDIYGFEVFKVNSFEQFCINYANEKLQQLFNRHVFKLEQEEYIREEIQWSFIDFYDNQVCIDLIEDRIGVFALLDEECMMPKGSDDSWALKMHQAFTEHAQYEKPRLSQTAFIVKHYAYDVQYEVGGFIEKNKDTLYEEHLVMLRGSDVSLLSEIFRAAEDAANEAADGGGRRPTKSKSRTTVGMQFQRSLEQLMDTLNQTDPHYIRCIKPNDAKAEFVYDRHRCAEQLRACGVLETVRISAAGYPSRRTYEDFMARYGLLASSRRSVDTSSVRASCESVLRPLIADEDKFQFGKTKLFFRAGQVAYLEKLRGDKRDAAATTIQKHIRQRIARRQYLIIRGAVMTIQRFARGMAARLLAENLRRERAAIHIQSTFRRFTQQRAYQQRVTAVRVLQQHYRGHLGRKRFRAALEEDCAIRLQTAWRRHKARSDFLKLRSNVVIAQSAVRRVWAVRVLKQLKLEARSVEGIKAKNVGLQQAVAELQSRLATANAEIEQHAAARRDRDQAEAAAVKAELDEVRERCETQAREVAVAREEHATALAELAAANTSLADENARLRGTTAQRDDEGVDDDGDAEDDAGALKAHVARLTLANRKLQERVAELEKNEVRRAVRTADADADTQDRLTSALATAESQLGETRAERDTIVTQSASDAAALTRLQSEFDALGVKYALRLEEQGVGELAAANDGLVTRTEELEAELTTAREESTAMRRQLDASAAEINHLKTENSEVADRLTNLEAGTAQRMAGKQKVTESAALQDEVVQLTEEIITLRESNDKLEAVLAQLRESGIAIPADTGSSQDGRDNDGSGSGSQRVATGGAGAKGSKRGMIRLDRGDVGRLVKDLITHLDPASLGRQQPLFAAHVLFMCVLFADDQNDEVLVQDLLVQVIRGIKGVTMQKAANLKFLAFWMAITFALVNCMRQCSGEKQFKAPPNTPILENFDFSEYRKILADVLVQVYQTIIRHIEHEITGLIGEGLLDYEPLGELGSPIRAAQKLPVEMGSGATAADVVARLDAMYAELEQAHCNIKLIHQVFAQVFTYINAVMVNNIMLRKDLCHWTTGIQIRRNLATVEEWSQKRGLASLLNARFVEVTQVSQLLQVNKTSAADLELICETCTKLQSLQVQKILSMYTPGPGEGKVPGSLIRQVAERGRDNGDGQLMMDAATIRKPTLPFAPQPPDFATLALPTGLSISTYLSRV